MGLRYGHDRDLSFKAVLEPFRFQGVLEDIRSKIAIEPNVGSGSTLS
jgi:hypothetical protein